MARVLRRAGYAVVNPSYPSTKEDVATLAEATVGPAVAEARAARPDARVHFVTHSMGSILLRAWFADREPAGFGRAVLLAPPSKGSEIVDALARLGLAETVLGPAGASLGTGLEAAPQVLPGLPIRHGVIAGSRSVNPAMSVFLPGDDDGKVTVERTKLETAADHITLPVSHPFLMNEPMTIWQTARFLRRGDFDHSARLSAIAK